MNSIEEHKRPYYLRPDEKAQHGMTLLVRFDDENDPEKYHYEAWGSLDEEATEPDTLMVYISTKLSKESITDSWKHYRRLWQDENYRNRHLHGETIH